MGEGQSRRVYHFLVTGIESPVTDVVLEGAVKQQGILRNHRDRCAQTFLGDEFDVLAINQDASALGLEQAQDEIDQGAFATARITDQADALAGAEYHFELPKYRSLMGVGEVHLLETNFTVRHHQRPGLRIIDHFMGAHDHVDPIIDIADEFKELEKASAQAARLFNQQQRQTGRHRELTGAHGALAPQAQRIANHRQHQDEGRDELEPAYAFHEPEGGACAFDFAVEIELEMLALEVSSREQFGGHDIRHRVDNSAAHRAARCGVFARVTPATSCQQKAHHNIDDGPHTQHQSQAHIDRSQQDLRHRERNNQRPEIKQHCPHDLRHAHRHFGNAIGKRAGKIGQEVALRMELQITE